MSSYRLYYKRLKSGKLINNPSLEAIIEELVKNMLFPLSFVSKIEKRFNLKIPNDEVGFITMFLTLGKNPHLDEANYPIVIVAMHGNSTATSMVDVARKLINAHNIYPYNMSLDKNDTVAYKELKELILSNIHNGGGVLLLVEYGLKMFAPLISEETGIKIKVIEMASTLTVLECARKAMIDKNNIIICTLFIQESHLNY